MKKNLGFTLMELVAVVVLIGLVSALAAVPISNVLKKSREDLNEKQKDQIILAATNWASDNPYSLAPYIGIDNFVDVTIEDLSKSGYLDTDVVDMRDKTKIAKCSYVRITLNPDGIDGNKNTYKYDFYEQTKEDCE